MSIPLLAVGYWRGYRAGVYAPDRIAAELNELLHARQRANALARGDG